MGIRGFPVSFVRIRIINALKPGNTSLKLRTIKQLIDILLGIQDNGCQR